MLEINTESIKESLNSFIEEKENIELNTQDEGYQIETQREANYFIRKYKELQEELDAIEEEKKESIANYKEKVELWAETETAKREKDMDRLKDMLKVYADNNRGDKQSLNLIEGTLQFRKQQDLIEYDEKEFIKQLREKKLNEYINIKITESVKKRDLNKNIKSYNGVVKLGDAVLENVTVTKREDSFTVK